MTRFMGLDLIVYMNWTRGSLWPIMGLTTQTNHQLAINALDAKGYDMVRLPLPASMRKGTTWSARPCLHGLS